LYRFSGGTFSSRKNFGFSKASCDWILSLDADERVTPELKLEIIKCIENYKLQNIQFAAFAIPRRNIIFGKEFRFGGQWPDYVIRLFQKDKFKGWYDELHEQPQINGKLGYLIHPLIHLKHDNISDMLTKTNDWSMVEAKLMFDAKHPPMNIIRFASAIIREFNLRMIRQKSFLDGTAGVIYALYQVFSRFLSYAKLWEMQLEKASSLGRKSS
jgi:hypothetical protein